MADSGSKGTLLEVGLEHTTRAYMNTRSVHETSTDLAREAAGCRAALPRGNDEQTVSGPCGPGSPPKILRTPAQANVLR